MKWSKVIRVDDEVYAWIKSHGKFGESYNDVVKRLIKEKEEADGGRGETRHPLAR